MSRPRIVPYDEAARRARRQLGALIDDLRAARVAAGLRQSTIAAKLGYSRQLIALWERGAVVPGLIQLARWGAIVGLDVPFRSHPAGSPLRDAGQLRLLGRARTLIGEAWHWRTEVPVSPDPHDRRAFDAVLAGTPGTIGLEAITRLTDAQAQVRAALLKQEAARVDRLVLVLADTRHNRAMVVAAASTLEGAFPASPREVIRTLRSGLLPQRNGILFV